MSRNNQPNVTLEQIAECALTFQRYIFRRAWGTYYAVWAVAYLVFVFAGQFPLYSLFPQNLSWVPYALLYGGVGLAAGLGTMWIFGKAHRTILLRKAMGSYQPYGRKWALMWIWWVGFFVMAYVIFRFLPSEALSIVFASLFVVEAFIYFTLKFSFPNKIPAEGIVALISYGFSVSLSFAVSLFNASYLIVELSWGITIALWIFCSIYALWRASEELVPLIY